jgi:23S rRNA (uracil1939-C5)-methyltransferase
MLQSEKTKTIIKLFKEYMIENNISAYNEETKQGIVKHIVVREADNDFVMTVVVTDEKFNKFTPLIEKLKSKFSSFGLFKNVNKLNNNVIFGNLDKKIYGIYELEKKDFGVQYFVNNRSFLQVNDEVKNLIYQKIIDTLGNQKNVIDAYSGAGLLSSVIAKSGANVYGVEIIKEATENANKLKFLNDLYNLTNKNGDCAKIIPELAKELKGNFAVVVDPPRKGLDDSVVDVFLKTNPKKIVYLSCNPATLARDLAKLMSEYKIEFVQPYDMFPQTANVETLVSLKHK